MNKSIFPRDFFFLSGEQSSKVKCTKQIHMKTKHFPQHPYESCCFPFAPYCRADRFFFGCHYDLRPPSPLKGMWKPTWNLCAKNRASSFLLGLLSNPFLKGTGQIDSHARASFWCTAGPLPEPSALFCQVPPFFPSPPLMHLDRHPTARARTLNGKQDGNTFP